MHWRPLVAGWKISLLVLVGVCLGVVLFGGMLVMYDATNDPFASQTALAGDVGAVQVTPRVQYGLTEGAFEAIEDATDGDAVPVVDGLTQIEGPSGAQAGVLLVGTDCRIEAYVGDFDCVRLLEEMDARGRTGSDEGIRLAVSAKTAAALGLEEGDHVGFPGGSSGEAVIDRVIGDAEVADASLARLNNGHWAVGSVPHVQDLLRVGPHLSRVLAAGDDVELPAEVAAVADLASPDAGIGAFLRLNLQMLLIVASLGLIGSMLIAGNTYALAVEMRRRQLALVSVVGMAPRRIFAGLVGEGALLGAVAGLAATVPAWMLGAWLARSWGRDLLSGIGATVEAPMWLWWLPLLCVGTGMALGALAAVPAAWRLNRSSHSGLLRGEVQTTMKYRVRRTYWFVPVGVVLLGGGLVAGWLWGRGEIDLYVGVAGAISLTLGCVVLVFGATPAVMLGFEWIFARGRAAAMLTASDLATDPLRWSTVVVVIAIALTLGMGFNALRHMSVDSLTTNITSEMGAKLHLYPRNPGEAAFARFDEAGVDRIRAVRGVADVSPQYLTIVELGDASLNVMATDPSRHRDNLEFDSGTDPEAVWAQLADDEDAIIVSTQVANRYDLAPGGTWVLPTVGGPHGFRVAAVAAAGFAEDNGIGPWIVVSADSIGKWWGVENPHFLTVVPDGETTPDELAERLHDVGVVRLFVLEPAGVQAVAASNGDRYVAPGERVGWVMVAFAAAAVAVFLLLALAQREHRRTLLRWIGYRRNLEWLNLLTEIGVVLGVAYVFAVGGAWALDWFMSLASPSLLASRVDWAVVPESLAAGAVAALLIGVVAVATTWFYAARLDKVLNARALGGQPPPLRDWFR
ncbi:MAG: ABC transporter permease [Acidimicrobiia bacterium]|nr:ABC transporter permease [Acidimicrobiia bacterium]